MEPLGRRARKKAATHRAIADAALRLFLERGFDAVSVVEVAEAADVSTTTLFKHFGTKEALVFDEDDARRDALVAAVRALPPGASVPQALAEHFAHTQNSRTPDGAPTPFLRLVRETPALAEHWRRLGRRHERALAEAIAEHFGVAPDDLDCAALARYAIETLDLVRGRPDQELALRHLFTQLERGWSPPKRPNPGRGR